AWHLDAGTRGGLGRGLCLCRGHDPRTGRCGGAGTFFGRRRPGRARARTRRAGHCAGGAPRAGLVRGRRGVVADLVMRPAPAAPANPGPGWGAAFLLWADRWWPRLVFRTALMAGTWVAMAIMPDRRAHSRAYLQALLGRPARAVEV